MRRTLLLLLLFFVPHSARGTSLLCPAEVPCCNIRAALSSVSVQTGVVYGSAPNLATNLTQALVMDVYSSSNFTGPGKRLPVVVLVHGGAFHHTSARNDSKFQQEAVAFSMRGFLAVSVEYRRYGGLLPDSPETVLHAAHDVLAAVRYISANAVALGADAGNIGMYGCSAGAIAVIYAVASEIGEGASGSPGFPSAVRAVVGGAGGFLTDPSLAFPLKPCTEIPPFLFIENYPDPVATNLTNGSRVPASSAALAAHGVPTDTVALGTGHCPLFTSTQGDAGQTVISNMVSWFLRYMEVPNCSLPGVPPGGAHDEWCPIAPPPPPPCPNCDTACASGGNASSASSASSATLLFEAFTEVFPVRDGSTILANESVFALAVKEHFSFLGVPDSLSAFCTEVDERGLLRVLMKASLGNLVLYPNQPLSERVQGPYMSNPITGKIERVDTFRSNRVAVFQVLVFSLLIALARSWFLLEKELHEHAQTKADLDKFTPLVLSKKH